MQDWPANPGPESDSGVFWCVRMLMILTARPKLREYSVSRMEECDLSDTGLRAELQRRDGVLPRR